MHPRIAIVPTTGASGVRKVRGASGARRRITSMHTETAVNAASVPALARAAIASIGATPAITATSTAVRIVIFTGAPRSDTVASLAGSDTPRAIVKKMRLRTEERCVGAEGVRKGCYGGRQHYLKKKNKIQHL